MRRYRVVTTDMNGGVSVMTDWKTWTECYEFILARWGHKPGFAHITSIASVAKLQRRFSNGV